LKRCGAEGGSDAQLRLDVYSQSRSLILSCSHEKTTPNSVKQNAAKYKN
jgi:hypothetical protein